MVGLGCAAVHQSAAASRKFLGAVALSGRPPRRWCRCVPSTHRRSPWLVSSAYAREDASAGELLFANVLPTHFLKFFFQKKCFIHLFKYTQNAWNTKRPEEMVDDIRFGFPEDVREKNPLEEDAAFAAQIGATLIKKADGFFSEYEMRNVSSGTRFKFYWRNIMESYWRLWKVVKKWCMEERDATRRTFYCIVFHLCRHPQYFPFLYASLVTNLLSSHKVIFCLPCHERDETASDCARRYLRYRYNYTMYAPFILPFGFTAGGGLENISEGLLMVMICWLFFLLFLLTARYKIYIYIYAMPVTAFPKAFFLPMFCPHFLEVFFRNKLECYY